MKYGRTGRADGAVFKVGSGKLARLGLPSAGISAAFSATPVTTSLLFKGNLFAPLSRNIVTGGPGGSRKVCGPAKPAMPANAVIDRLTGNDTAFILSAAPMVRKPQPYNNG